MSSVILIASLVVLSKFWIRLICSNFFYKFLSRNLFCQGFFLLQRCFMNYEVLSQSYDKTNFYMAPPPYIFFGESGLSPHIQKLL